MITNRHLNLIAGEWWNADIIDVAKQAQATGGGPNISDAYTINGRPGDLYPCSQNRMCVCVCYKR